MSPQLHANRRISHQAAQQGHEDVTPQLYELKLRARPAWPLRHGFKLGLDAGPHGK